MTFSTPLTGTQTINGHRCVSVYRLGAAAVGVDRANVTLNPGASLYTGWEQAVTRDGRVFDLTAVGVGV